MRCMRAEPQWEWKGGAGWQPKPEEDIRDVQIVNCKGSWGCLGGGPARTRMEGSKIWGSVGLGSGPSQSQGELESEKCLGPDNFLSRYLLILPAHG